MRGLGRNFNTIAVASGAPFSMKDCSSVAVVAVTTTTAATSIAFNARTSFGGANTAFTPANGFGQAAFWYQNTSNAGTAQWTKQAAVWSTNSLTISGTINQVSVVEIFASQMADTFDYLVATGTNCTFFVLTHDLLVQRKAENLVALGA